MNEVEKLLPLSEELIFPSLGRKSDHAIPHTMCHGDEVAQSSASDWPNDAWRYGIPRTGFQLNTH